VGHRIHQPGAGEAPRFKERAVMGRVTRSPPKPGLKYEHAVSVSQWGAVDGWVWPEAERAAGIAGYQVETRGWASTRILFDTQAKADEFRYRLKRHREEVERAELRKRPCPVRVAYEKASLGQHAVIWSLSTGIIRDVVQAYRRARLDCTAHGTANFAAAKVIVARCPWMDHNGWEGHERARDMAEHMLVYIEARHRDWFWRGPQGELTF
jgi:hypothetical protein